MDWAPGQDATRTPSQGGVPGLFNWEKTSGKAQNQLERLYLHSGLGAPGDPPVRVGLCGRGTGSLMEVRSGWMDGWSCCTPV